MNKVSLKMLFVWHWWRLYLSYDVAIRNGACDYDNMTMKYYMLTHKTFIQFRTHNMNALFQCHGHFDAIYKYECVFEIYDWMLADVFSIPAIRYILKHPEFIVHIKTMM